MGNKILILAICTTLLFLLGCTSTSNYSGNSSGSSYLSVDQIKSSAQMVSYDDLFRYNESYVGKIVVFTGKIVQVVDDYPGQSFRVNIDQSSMFGNDVIYLHSYTGTRLLQDDVIKFYGKVSGLIEYKAVLGNNVTIPSIETLHVEFIDNESLDEQVQKTTQSIAQSITGETTSNTDEDEPVINANLNEEINIGEFNYIFTKAETFTKMGALYTEATTTGKFIKVYFTITNNSNKPQYMSTSEIKLVDSKDRQFDEYSMSTMYISDGFTLLDKLQPGLPMSGALVFELPKDSVEIKAQIVQGWQEELRATINLGTIKNIGSDTTLQEEQDATWDDLMDDSQQEWEEMMNQCTSPFSCSSSCPEYMGVGQKDCPNNQVCCMEQ